MVLDATSQSECKEEVTKENPGSDGLDLPNVDKCQDEAETKSKEPKTSSQCTDGRWPTLQIYCC